MLTFFHDRQQTLITGNIPQSDHDVLFPAKAGNLDMNKKYYIITFKAIKKMKMKTI